MLYTSTLMLTSQETASDVVSWTDAVARVTVLSEVDNRENVGRPEQETGGASTRTVTLRVDEVLWHNPAAPALPDQVRLTQMGWATTSLRDGPVVRKRMVTIGSVWTEVGATYLMPLARSVRDGWTQGASLAEFEIVDGRIVTGPHQDTPLARELAGKSVAEAAKVFNLAKPDPASVEFAHLPLRQRVQASQTAAQ